MVHKIKKSTWDKIDWGKLPPPVIGVDEAGRGCLAGPVSAAAVIIKDLFGIEHYTDSKLLSPDRREYLAKDIIARQIFSVGFATRAEIDTVKYFAGLFIGYETSCFKIRCFFWDSSYRWKVFYPKFKGV